MPLVTQLLVCRPRTWMPRSDFRVLEHCCTAHGVFVCIMFSHHWGRGGCAATWGCQDVLRCCCTMNIPQVLFRHFCAVPSGPPIPCWVPLGPVRAPHCSAPQADASVRVLCLPAHPGARGSALSSNPLYFCTKHVTIPTPLRGGGEWDYK